MHPWFTPLPHLGGLYPDIHYFPVQKVDSEDLTSGLQFIEVSVCGLGGVWDPKARPLHTPDGPLEEFIFNLFLT